MNYRNIKCPNCDKYADFAVRSSSGNKWYSGNGWYSDIRCYFRKLECLNCGHTLRTVEIEKRFLDELFDRRDKIQAIKWEQLVTLRNKLKTIKEEAEQSLIHVDEAIKSIGNLDPVLADYLEDVDLKLGDLLDEDEDLLIEPEP